MSLKQNANSEVISMDKTIKPLSEIHINVTGIDVQRGGDLVVMIFLKKGFPKNHKDALFTQSSNKLVKNMKFVFNLNSPEYAIKVWHDENGDGKVTKNWTGIYPKEGLCFSNQQQVTLTGPPKYKKSKLTVADHKNKINIAIIYP